jgi:hypothetical protein
VEKPTNDLDVPSETIREEKQKDFKWTMWGHFKHQMLQWMNMDSNGFKWVRQVDFEGMFNL